MKEFAEKANVDVELTNIPVIDRDLYEFATENFIIPNSAIGTNGAIVMFTSKKIANDLIDDLRKAGETPEVVG